eukprot:1183766-Prorocentrum_minimum.AAC.3
MRIVPKQGTSRKFRPRPKTQAFHYARNLTFPALQHPTSRHPSPLDSSLTWKARLAPMVPNHPPLVTA